ncbi:MAG: OmpH family outer membrane protein [Bacteroidales bacterium]|nr:OmpH family outer membrane protein [Bacteroidales bacterium]
MTQENSNKKSPVIISLVLSMIAIIGLVILFVMEFTDEDKPEEKQSGIALPVSASGSNSIVFINSDLILEKYLLVNKLAAQLERERQKKDADFEAKQKVYEQDGQYFQQQVQQQSISEQSAQQIYEQLMIKQQELYELQEQYTAELAQKEYAMNIILLDSVRNYLTRLNNIYNYDYILSYNTAGNIILAKDTFDITLPVLEGLNMEYDDRHSPTE